MKKITTALLICSLFTLTTPNISRAQWVVLDPAQQIKEYGLDTVAFVAAKIAIKKLTAKTVNWINSGFKGNPSYVTNPKQFFLDVGDGVASDFLSQNGVNQICAPFRANVRLALVSNYINDTGQNYSCTLSILRNNYNNFINDFRQGGWDAWFELTQNNQNNPYGAYFMARNNMDQLISGKTQQFQQEVSVGSGFLSFKRCPRGADFIDPVSLQRVCGVEEETVTPGSIISAQINESLTGPWKELVAADEFNEVITALITQLIEQVAGRAGGLLGASERDPTTGRASFTSQLDTENQPFVNYRISATSGSINCSSSGGSGGSGGGSSGGGSGGSGGNASCRSTPGSISGLPAWPLGSGGGGGGGGACPAYTPDPNTDCTRVDAGAVLSVLNGYPPSNNGMRAAAGQIQSQFGGTLLNHPVRLDKFDFGNGMIVDVMIGAVGNAGPDGEDSLAEGGWGWLVECACNRNPSGSDDPNPPIPLPGGGNTYTVTVGITGLGQVHDGTDTCSTVGVGVAPTGNPPRCSKPYPRNSYQSLHAIPAVGQTFLGWGGACAVFGTADTCFGNVTGNGDVIANFTP